MVCGINSSLEDLGNSRVSVKYWGLWGLQEDLEPEGKFGAL